MNQLVSVILMAFSSVSFSASFYGWKEEHYRACFRDADILCNTHQPELMCTCHSNKTFVEWDFPGCDDKFLVQNPKEKLLQLKLARLKEKADFEKLDDTLAFIFEEYAAIRREFLFIIRKVCHRRHLYVYFGFLRDALDANRTQITDDRIAYVRTTLFTENKQFMGQKTMKIQGLRNVEIIPTMDSNGHLKPKPDRYDNLSTRLMLLFMLLLPVMLSALFIGPLLRCIYMELWHREGRLRRSVRQWLRSRRVAL